MFTLITFLTTFLVISVAYCLQAFKKKKTKRYIAFALGGGGDSLAAISLASKNNGVAVISGNSLSCVETYVTTKGRQNTVIIGQVKSNKGLTEGEHQEYLRLVLSEETPLFYRLRNDRTDEETSRFEELAKKIGYHYNSLVQESRQAHRHPNVPIYIVYSIGGTSEKYIDSTGESMNPSKLDGEINVMESGIQELISSFGTDLRITGIDTGGDVLKPDNARDSLVHRALLRLQNILEFEYYLMIIGASVDGHHENPLQLIEMMKNVGFSCKNTIPLFFLKKFKMDDTYEKGRANHVVALMWEHIKAKNPTKKRDRRERKCEERDLLKEARDSVNKRREPNTEVFANLLTPEHKDSLAELSGVWVKQYFPNQKSILSYARNYLHDVSVPIYELDRDLLFEYGKKGTEAYANYVPGKTIDPRITKLPPHVVQKFGLITRSDDRNVTVLEMKARATSKDFFGTVEDQKNSLDGSNGPNLCATNRKKPTINLFQLTHEEQEEYLDNLIHFANEDRSKIFEMFIEKIEDEGLQKFVRERIHLFRLALFCQTWAKDGTANFSIPSPHFQCVFLPEENAFDGYEVYLEHFRKFWKQMAETYPKKFVCVYCE